RLGVEFEPHGTLLAAHAARSAGAAAGAARSAAGTAADAALHARAAAGRRAHRAEALAPAQTQVGARLPGQARAVAAVARGPVVHDAVAVVIEARRDGVGPP